MIVSLDTIAPGKIPSIRVSADPVQPKEAIDWFGKKSPLDKESWKGLSEEARKRAFTAAWVADVHVLQGVKDSLKQAIESGESFESWKRRIRSELGERWKRDNPYLETVFRNNVQSAYAAGRYKAQTTPLILRMRPFWRLVVILDARTSEICSRLAKPPVVLPAEHPWWAAHWPPLHHRCRTTTVSMSRRQAERAGILQKAPSVAAQEGWGSTMGLGEWQPDGKSIDPKIFEPAKKAAEKTPERKPEVKPPAQVPEVRPASRPRRIEDLPTLARPKDTAPAGGEAAFLERARKQAGKLSQSEKDSIGAFSYQYDWAIRQLDKGVPARRVIDAVRAFRDANPGKRWLDGSPEEHVALAKEYLKDIRSAFRKAAPIGEVTVYRGLTGLSEATLAGFLALKTVRIDAVSSTSWRASVALDFAEGDGPVDGKFGVLLVMRQRNGLAIQELSGSEYEKEILIKRGTKFRVVNRYRLEGRDDILVLEVEEID